MPKKKSSRPSGVSISNKRATFNYFLTDRYTAGIVLAGCEIKSIRKGKASLVDAYCTVEHGEMWIHSMYVAPYEYTSYGAQGTRRDRKLLLQRREIKKLERSSKNPGITMVPTRLFLNDAGYAKVEIAIARGKKLYDKRQALRAADDKRAVQQGLKRRY